MLQVIFSLSRIFSRESRDSLCSCLQNKLNHANVFWQVESLSKMPACSQISHFYQLKFLCWWKYQNNHANASRQHCMRRWETLSALCKRWKSMEVPTTCSSRKIVPDVLEVRSFSLCKHFQENQIYCALCACCRCATWIWKMDEFLLKLQTKCANTWECLLACWEKFSHEASIAHLRIRFWSFRLRRSKKRRRSALGSIKLGRISAQISHCFVPI